MIETLAMIGGLTTILLLGIKNTNDRFRVGPNKPLSWGYWLAGALSGAVAAVVWVLSSK